MIELTVNDLHLQYGNNPVLKGVSMQLQKGEVVSLLGPSGSGKTTLLRAVAGLEQASQGTVQIGDRVMFDGARKLQLPIYAHAARNAVADGRISDVQPDAVVEAAYWFVRQGKRDWIEVILTADLQADYADAVRTLVASIAKGCFPAKAPDVPDFSWVQCSYCNPDGLGHGEVRTRWERKRHDPALHDLVSLIDPGALAGAAEATSGVEA